VLLVVLLVAAVAPAAAHAGTVTFDPQACPCTQPRGEPVGVFTFTAAPGESNNLSVNLVAADATLLNSLGLFAPFDTGFIAGAYVFSDRGGPVTPGDASCTAVGPDAVCPFQEGRAAPVVDAFLGDGNDRMTSSPVTPYLLDLGPGDDVADFSGASDVFGPSTLICGTGDDSVVVSTDASGHPVDNIAADCEHVVGRCPGAIVVNAGVASAAVCIGRL
jgi:hypothetical protein